MPKKLEGYCSGRGRHTMITSYGYGMLRLKEGPNQPGPIFSTLYIYFVQFLLLINYSLWDRIYIRPRIFLFSRPPFRDSYSRLMFRDSTRDSHSRLAFHDSTRDPLSRLTFATPLATPISDSRSRLHSRLTFATPDHAPNRDSLFFVTTSIVRLHH